jgi:hypothetical protein
VLKPAPIASQATSGTGEEFADRAVIFDSLVVLFPFIFVPNSASRQIFGQNNSQIALLNDFVLAASPTC